MPLLSISRAQFIAASITLSDAPNDQDAIVQVDWGDFPLRAYPTHHHAVSKNPNESLTIDIPLWESDLMSD
jgi:hypothetical protein